MRNIFILYMPPGNHEAVVHYEDTIRQKVMPDRIYRHVQPAVRRRLEAVFGDQRIAVWGSADGRQNRARFENMREGDEVLIVFGPTIKLLGRVAATVVNPSLSRELWQGLQGEPDRRWDLIYFIANPREIELPFDRFKEIIGWRMDSQLRGFTNVAEDKRAAFYARYGDLYSVLVRMRENQPVETRIDPAVVREDGEVAAAGVEEVGALTDEPERGDSDHLRMQWLLAKLGRQAGEKVWAPRGDQSCLRGKFEFGDFEETFAAGLDARTDYLENIDVVWKDQFRIDAAFEVENSTSIYSGLLRFADLSMVAPNTVYPMFIVAPTERRERVRRQLDRPTFRHLKLGERVRFLSYERVDEVDRFFRDAPAGLNVGVFVGRSEQF